jgi:hypothetical protein
VVLGHSTIFRSWTKGLLQVPTIWERGSVIPTNEGSASSSKRDGALEDARLEPHALDPVEVVPAQREVRPLHGSGRLAVAMPEVDDLERHSALACRHGQRRHGASQMTG